MNLKEIIDHISWRKYRAEPDDTQREDLVRLINQAAREVWRMSDWPRTLREQSFPVQFERIVSLPFGIGEVRAIRDDVGPVALHTRVPRFNAEFWKPETCRIFRIIGKSPTVKSRLNATTLFVEDNDADAVITFVGRTPLANRKTVTFTGNGEVPYSNYNALESVRKDRKTERNVIIRESEGCILSELPNNQFDVSYIIIELGEYTQDKCHAKGFPRCIEVLYKPTLPQLVDDYDEFPAQEMGDAVIAKFWEIDSITSNNFEAAMIHERKAQGVIDSTTRDAERGVTFEMKLPRKITMSDVMRRNNYGSNDF